MNLNDKKKLTTLSKGKIGRWSIVIALGLAPFLCLKWTSARPFSVYQDTQIVEDQARDERIVAYVEKSIRSNTVYTAVGSESINIPWPSSWFTPKYPRANIFVCRNQHRLSLRWQVPKTLVITTDCDPRPDNPDISLQALRADGMRIQYEFLSPQSEQDRDSHNKKRKA